MCGMKKAGAGASANRPVADNSHRVHTSRLGVGLFREVNQLKQP